MFQAESGRAAIQGPIVILLNESWSHVSGCFSKDQVYLDGVLKILRYRDKINFPLLMALGKVIKPNFIVW